MNSHHELISTITSVCVFRTGAQVQRTASITIANETAQLFCKIGHLPMSMNDQSLRFSVTKGKGAYISDFSVNLEAPNRFLRDSDELRLEIKELRRQRVLIEHKESGLTDEINELKDLTIRPRPLGSRRPPPPSPYEQRLEFMTFRTDQLSQLTGELVALREDLKAAKRRLKELQEKFKRSSSDRVPEPNEFKKAVHITLSSDAESLPQSIELRMDYQIPGARWVPAYVMNLTENITHGHLALRAVVCQSTGEDWKNISLRLSTAFPLAWHDLPKLKSRRIGQKQSQPPGGWQASSPSPDKLFKDFDHKFRPEAIEPVPRILEAAPQPEPEPFEAETVAAENLFTDQILHDGLLPAKNARLPEKPIISTKGIDKTRKLSRPRPDVVSSAKYSAYRRQIASSASTPPTRIEALPTDPEPFWDYCRLRLSAPDDPKRGALHMIDELEVYYERLVQERISVAQIKGIVEGAVDLEKQCLRSPIPERHQIPTDLDGFDVIYDADLPVDIPSDSTFHSIPLCGASLQMDPLYVCAPRELQKAFRTVRVTNPFSAPLLSGPIDVYIDNDYLLTAALSVTPQEGRLSVGLGIEESINIARNCRFREESSGLMKGDNDLIHHITIDVTNHLPTAITLELRERIPTVPEDEKLIKVNIGATTPPWKPFQQKDPELDGGYCWIVEMAPGEFRQFTTSYTINIPSKNILVGGNRREV